MRSLKLATWYICLLRDTKIFYGSITYASKQTATVFEPRNLGPFSIIQKISSHAYKLKLPPSFRIHPVIHIKYLTKHNPTDKFSSREIIPPPETVMDDGTIEFEVDSILSHRVRKYGRGSRLEYLIHWKGYAKVMMIHGNR